MSDRGVVGVHCRPAGVDDFSFLATMLGEAAVWRPDKPTPTAESAGFMLIEQHGTSWTMIRHAGRSG